MTLCFLDFWIRDANAIWQCCPKEIQMPKDNKDYFFYFLRIRYAKWGLRWFECSKVWKCKGLNDLEEGYSTTLSLIYVSIWVIKGLTNVTKKQDDKMARWGFLTSLLSWKVSRKGQWLKEIMLTKSNDHLLLKAMILQSMVRFPKPKYANEMRT